MKVSELVALLQSFPQDYDVVIDGYEGGVSDVSIVEARQVVIDANKDQWYYGKHELYDADREYCRDMYGDSLKKDTVHITC